MTVLVTGGAGFIGSNFVLDWFECGVEAVVTLDAMTYAGTAQGLAELPVDAPHTLVRGSIADRHLVKNVLKEYRPRAVVHFAAETHVDRSIDSPAAFIDTNIYGTFALLESVREYLATMPNEDRRDFRFLHVSTDEVFGSLEVGEAAFTEGHAYEPNSPYAASKAASDHLVRAWHRTYGVPVLLTNCSNNYGPFQFEEKLIPLLVDRALRGEDLPIYGDGQQVRDWLFVGDHCAALRAVLKRGVVGESYNIGGRCERTNLQVASAVCSLLDELSPRSVGSYFEQVRFVKDRPGHDRRYAVDTSKVERCLGWAPAEGFESGLRKTVSWCVSRRVGLGETGRVG
ncbi:dTDP-glucose 4,6-dehydratase [Ottowia sp.]|uniref:dTDP-glucose 4,6-dehydratase n=1 Tax=Ottowia sp. TaxID=1898956 RepID=UPI0025D500AE|nr:dTDP-glucose 4,6-dehydratase [Ottowia sp.]MBK6616590.1 dTDP-glucose 4,6-dehydratase [Ottowia sp.]